MEFPPVQDYCRGLRKGIPGKLRYSTSSGCCCQLALPKLASGIQASRVAQCMLPASCFPHNSICIGQNKVASSGREGRAGASIGRQSAAHATVAMLAHCNRILNSKSSVPSVFRPKIQHCCHQRPASRSRRRCGAQPGAAECIQPCQHIALLT